MREQALEFVEVGVSQGSHVLHLKMTGEVLGTFMHRWDALRVAYVVDRALRTMTMRRSGTVSGIRGR